MGWQIRFRYVRWIMKLRLGSFDGPVISWPDRAGGDPDYTWRFTDPSPETRDISAWVGDTNSITLYAVVYTAPPHEAGINCKFDVLYDGLHFDSWDFDNGEGPKTYRRQPAPHPVPAPPSPGPSPGPAPTPGPINTIRRCRDNTSLDPGYIAVDYDFDVGSPCPNPFGLARPVVVARRLDDIPIGGTLRVCRGQPVPVGWVYVGDDQNRTVCPHDPRDAGNPTPTCMILKRVA